MSGRFYTARGDQGQVSNHLISQPNLPFCTIFYDKMLPENPNWAIFWLIVYIFAL